MQVSTDPETEGYEAHSTTGQVVATDMDTVQAQESIRRSQAVHWQYAHRYTHERPNDNQAGRVLWHCVLGGAIGVVGNLGRLQFIVGDQIKSTK
jgi:hypothetical protein